MTTTIEKLKKRGTFIVESWCGVKHYVAEGGKTARKGGSKESEYEFTYSEHSQTLCISGDVFGTEAYEVLNQLEVLYGIAKGFAMITVKIEGVDVKIYNSILR